MYKDITLLIQGPANSTSLSRINEWKKTFGSVVVSTWYDDAFTELHELIRRADNYVALKPFDKRKFGGKGFSYSLQTATCLSGINLVETEYVVKMRSDEAFSDFSLMTEMIVRNPKKIVSLNVCFVCFPEREIFFHPSDHCYGGRTKTLKEAYGKIFNSLLGKADIIDLKTATTGEESLGRAIVSCLGHDPLAEAERKQAKDIMKKHFLICPLSKMGNFILSFNKAGRKVVSLKEWTSRVVPHAIHCYERIEDL
jgi:hypothetical protein